MQILKKIFISTQTHVITAILNSLKLACLYLIWLFFFNYAICFENEIYMQLKLGRFYIPSGLKLLFFIDINLLKYSQNICYLRNSYRNLLRRLLTIKYNKSIRIYVSSFPRIFIFYILLDKLLYNLISDLINFWDHYETKEIKKTCNFFLLLNLLRAVWDLI